MNPLIKHIIQNDKLIEISDCLVKEKNENINLIGLTDSAKAGIAYALTMRSKKSSVIVCSNVMQAKKIMQDLKFFSELEIMARRFLPDITSFFEKDENKQRYEKWKEENVETAHLTKPTD